ncbi:MAG: RagB/SusD family nutrient uptake outer membrane protein [Gemmatimonadota bacterium]|nr:RagB/SusD family nutrient uptake outer membrane protein [Gemmatimonadota bacterium]
MTSYMTSAARGARVRRTASGVTLALSAALTLSLAACTPTDVLEVRDPDIINPEDVQSAAGANAARLGAIARLNAATSGGSTASEGLFLLSGLLADEWNNGDSFIARWEVDQRSITPQNLFLTDVDRLLNRARLSATQAIGLLEQFNPSGPKADVAEMYFVRAYVENAIGEHYCNGLVLSTVVDGVEQHGLPITTTAAFDSALAHADNGLAVVTGSTVADVRVRNALAVIKGRILLNLNRPAEAAAAVAGVPTSFRYQMLHSQTTNDDAMWTYNNVARRYSVSTGEGTNGLNFALAKDPRVPICVGGDATCVANGTTQTRRDDNSSAPLYVQLIWPVRTAPVTIAGGVEARLIEAEAAFKTANYALFVQKLNQARTESVITGLVGNLVDPGTDPGRVDLLFRERAFSLFSTGHRVGDMRRLIKYYNRSAESVFPTGAWHKGGSYSSDVNFPVPQAEENNPNVTPGKTCTDRAA